MFSDVEIEENLTKATFGYDLNNLSGGSRKKIVVVCKNCKKILHREFRNRFSKHQCPITNGNQKRCYKCKTWKDLSLFNKSTRLSGGVSKLCRECYNKHESVKKAEKNRLYRLKNSFEYDIDLYMKTRCRSILSRSKIKNIEFNLTKEFLLELWEKQDGLCYYTNIPMSRYMKTSGFQCWDSPSLDRVNPSKGYVKDNVVWCIFSINSFKQSLSIDEFEKQIHNIEWWFNRK